MFGVSIAAAAIVLVGAVMRFRVVGWTAKELEKEEEKKERKPKIWSFQRRESKSRGSGGGM